MAEKDLHSVRTAFDEDVGLDASTGNSVRLGEAPSATDD